MDYYCRYQYSQVVKNVKAKFSGQFQAFVTSVQAALDHKCRIIYASHCCTMRGK